MDTKLKTNNKFRAFLSRILAGGALFTMLLSGIMGREAVINLWCIGPNSLSGDIYYLRDFQEYVATLGQQALIGYAGVGDDNGQPLSDNNAEQISLYHLSDFHTSLKYVAEKDMLYYIDRDGQVPEAQNVSENIFSEQDGQLTLPADASLCIYWDGPNNTFHFFDREYTLEQALQIFERFTTLQYQPNMEEASHLRLILAVCDTDSYSSYRLYRFHTIAENHQQVLIVFVGSLILFLITGVYNLLSRKSAGQMWQDYSRLALKLWMECKLIIVALCLYICYSYNLWGLNYSMMRRAASYEYLWMYLPTGILLYLFGKDLSLNKTEAWTHSLTGTIIRFIKEFVSGIKSYRKMLILCLLTLFSSLTMIIAGGIQLYIYDKYILKRVYIKSIDMLLVSRMGWLLCIMGVILLLVYAGLRRFMRDANAISLKLSELRKGASKAPLTLPPFSLLRETVADLNAVEEGIEVAVEQRNRSNKMRVELITNVSHDLKTPLTSIINYADLLCEENLEGPAAGYASALQAKAYRLKGMVQDVFELSKATSGNLPVEKTVLDLAKLLKQTLADMDERITESTLTFKLNITTEPIMIEADGEKLYRVFQNLIVNALQYSLENSRVHIQLTTENGYAHAKVKNTSRQELDFDPEEIIERFVRADSSRTTEGNGLGLSIVQSFTEACGGCFRISTDADMFTACVSFPLAEVPQTLTAEASTDSLTEVTDTEAHMVSPAETPGAESATAKKPAAPAMESVTATDSTD